MNTTSTERRIQTVCLLILSAVSIAVALYWLRPVMIPFVMALFFALGLTPLIHLQMHYLRAPRPVAILGTLILGVAMLSLLALLVSTSVSQLAANASEYQAQIGKLFDKATKVLPLERFGIRAEAVANPLSQISVQSVGGALVRTANAIVGIMSQGLLVLIFMIFLLVGGVGASASTGVWSEVEARIQRYILTKAIISGATGVLVGATLMLLGVDLALVFGLLAFLLNFIPSIGSFVATLLPLPVVLVSPDVSTTTAVLAITLPGGIQLALGNLVEPKIMGESLDLHPVVILMALIFWGMLWGVVGMLLATPITAVVKIFFEKLELTAPLGDLLAGRLQPRAPRA